VKQGRHAAYHGNMADQDDTHDQMQTELQQLREEKARLTAQVQTLHALEQALRRSEGRCLSVIAALDEGIIIHDKAGAIVEVNDSAGRIMGVPRGELVGRASLDPSWRSFDEHGRPFDDFCQPARQTLLTGEPQSGVIMALDRPSRPLVWLSVNTQPLRESPQEPPYGVVCSLFDITELKQTQERLATSERWLKEAQHVAHVGSWAYEIDTQRVIRSDELYRIYGIADDETRRTFEPMLEHIHPDDRERFLEAMRGAVEAEQPVTIEHRIQTARDAIRHVVVRAQLVTDADGRPRALVGTTQDVTELKAYEAEMAKRTAELQQAREMDRLKGQLVDAVSHELRTPLTSIAGYAEFLEDQMAGPLTPNQTDYVKQILVGAKRLERLIDDLLDFARLEAGSFRLAVQPTELNELVAHVVENLQPQSLEVGVPLTVQPHEGSLLVMIDPKRVEQVLLNLVGNALKFTPKGGAVAVRVQPAGGLACVQVTDTGIGIAPEHLPRLFDKFFQVNPSTTREHGGAGLGLAIAKALVEAMGGTLHVESELGKGSTFWFTLPRAAE
jgi:PAS domain S-box-containing protein